MRISVSEWTVLRAALRLPRALLNPQLLWSAIRKHAFTRRGTAIAAVGLLLILVLLHMRTADPSVAQLSELSAQLAAASLIESRWNVAITRARSGESPSDPVQPTEESVIQRALDRATTHARTTVMRETLNELRKAYVEKADLVSRLGRASADSQQALSAALRADATITASIRSAWRDFPQRERLVAAENLTVRVISEAQQYHYTPSAAHRASLTTYAADLPRARALPENIAAGLQRLEADVHRILLLKPLEHMLAERLAALKTERRMDEVRSIFQAELSDALAGRERYRVALIAYTLALTLLAIYWGARAIARYRDLELLYAAQARELARALRPAAAPSARVTELRRPDAARIRDEEARIISER